MFNLRSCITIKKSLEEITKRSAITWVSTSIFYIIFYKNRGLWTPLLRYPPLLCKVPPPTFTTPPFTTPPFTTQKDYPSPTGGGTLTIMISWPWTLFTHLVKKKIHSTICWWFLSSKISNKSFKFIVLSKVSILMNLLIYV